MRLSVALTLALAVPALAQETPHLPLNDLERVEAGLDWSSTLRQRVTKLARLAGGKTLVPPTTGTLRLGVVLVEFPDQKRPAAFAAPRNWEDAFFSQGSYTQTATGERAHGSLRDFYRENSGGHLDVQGRVFDWVEVETTRQSLAEQPLVTPGVRDRLFSAAVDRVLARDGKDALADVDALVFVCAGASRLEGSSVTRGSILWPHSTLFTHGGKAWRYYTIESGLKWFEPIGVHCHELGHVLGIYDKYGIGSDTGMGQWCLMASGAHGPRRGRSLDSELKRPGETLRRVIEDQLQQGQDMLRRLLRPRAPDRPADGTDQPLHFCAVCKTRLGWSDPVTVDPRRGQRAYLTPIEEDPDQVLRVLLDARGRESLYLEYRAPRGFDARLGRGGLVVWRVGSPGSFLRTLVLLEAVELIPAHGQDTTDAALRDPSSIPFPLGTTDSVTVRGKGRDAWAVTLSGIVERDGKLFLEVKAAE